MTNRISCVNQDRKFNVKAIYGHLGSITLNAHKWPAVKTGTDQRVPIQYRSIKGGSPHEPLFPFTSGWTDLLLLGHEPARDPVEESWRRAQESFDSLVRRPGTRVCMEERYVGTVDYRGDDHVTVRYMLPDGDLIEHEYSVDQFRHGAVPRLGDRLTTYIRVELTPRESLAIDPEDLDEDELSAFHEPDDKDIERGIIEL